MAQRTGPASEESLAREMCLLNNVQTNRLLGYPPDARLLILNADDFGMCHAVNAAIVRVLEAGVICFTTLQKSAKSAESAD